MTEGGVRVRTGRERFRTEVTAKGHQFVVDEPISAGGTGLGPAAFDLLAAALGSCTAITLRMYADRKEWPLEAVTARVEHRRERRGEGEGSRDIFMVDL